MYQTLTHTIRLYVPTTINVSTHIDTSEYVAEALKKFSQWFGGATRYEAKGAWLSEAEAVVIEDIIIVESKASSGSFENGKAQVIAYAELLKEQLHQEAVSVEVDGELILVGITEE